MNLSTKWNLLEKTDELGTWRPATRWDSLVSHRRRALPLLAAVFATCRLAAQPLVFEAPVSYPTGQFPYLVVADDFNGDLIPDIAVVNNGVWGTGIGSVSVLHGMGDGTFQTATTYTAT